jgi:hypothetical protein
VPSSSLISLRETLSSQAIRGEGGGGRISQKTHQGIKPYKEKNKKKKQKDFFSLASSPENNNDDNKDDSKVITAGSLFKQYGFAYLATSIPLSALSFGILYFLVDAGIDVAELFEKVGLSFLNADAEAANKVGTFAIAYAAHKAASPLRFPPTVFLTPVVAKLLGRSGGKDDEKKKE